MLDNETKTTYTIELYKEDKRYNKGHRMVYKKDHNNITKEQAEEIADDLVAVGFGHFYKIHLTFVTKKNLLSGIEFQERYDTPYYCSPSSEAYWSS
jgi:hypothetical protein